MRHALSSCPSGLRRADIERGYRPEGRKRFVKIGRLAHHQNRKLILVNVFVGRAFHILPRHAFDPGAVALEKVSRVTIGLISHALA